MIPTAVFTYATTLLSLFAMVNAQVQLRSYTSYQEFVDDIPSCNKDCMEVDIDAVYLTCGSTGLECACSQTLRLEQNVGANRSQACVEACPDSEDADMAAIAQNVFSTCLPFIIANPAAFNTTTEQLEELGLIGSTDGTNSSSSNASNVTTTGSAPVATQTTNAAGSLLASSFLIAAVPAVLSFLV
ncbi:uncharacterized protein LAJ45_10527 [Morchella importuna]|uniref:uncharacterized protein n=1 Tax=Morchella importuna TaxID=1174673 RepID=UPI001E8E56CF|nr:uncharacterized protein LAJ45_10527 [Morchella importuna]KAH8145406.1 hypothetical protein LAJ45_10527 [Morchella importuna]